MKEILIVELFARQILRYIFTTTKGGKEKASENRPNPKLSFQKFSVRNFKGIEKADIELAKNGLVLLLGLNESGKTTILKSIEAFSFMNDPLKEFKPDFFQKIRKKSAVGSADSAIVTAEIAIEKKLNKVTMTKLGNEDISSSDLDLINAFIQHLNEIGQITISRVFPFKNGSPVPYYYRFETDHPFAQTKLASKLAHEIVAICPFIIYFEDFKDRIPEKIFVNKKRDDSFDPVWYDIINGLFYNTDPKFSIEEVKRLHSPSKKNLDDATTVETRVNKTLNETFTKKWQELSGVQEIEQTELKYNHHPQSPFYTLKIKDKDGTTYSVDERSKGALWYLSFLMKTEFRSKKMRQNSGKPVFLIDEPASNLHSTAQKNMINDFKTLAADTSIIYTTHSQYLISTENIKNTYVVEKKNGAVVSQKWGQYLSREDAQVSYYQPLANLLDIIPNTFDIPWEKCVITEGPSDRHVLIAMYRILHKAHIPFSIYPGNSAHNLGSLISLNIGWNSKFVVLLDNDEEGNKAATKYEEQYGLGNEIIRLPETHEKIEKCFSLKEKEAIRDMVLKYNSGTRVSKKEFASAWGMIAEQSVLDDKIKAVLSKDTLKLFAELFDSINERLIEKILA